LRPRLALQSLELLVSHRPGPECGLLAQEPGTPVAVESMLRVRRQRGGRHRAAQPRNRNVDRPRRRRLPQCRRSGRHPGQDVRCALPYRSALPGVDLFATGLLRRPRGAMLPKGSRHAAAPRSLLHVGSSAVILCCHGPGSRANRLPCDYRVGRKSRAMTPLSVRVIRFRRPSRGRSVASVDRRRPERLVRSCRKCRCRYRARDRCRPC